MTTTDLARQDDTRTDLAVADREQAAGALAHILATGDLRQLTDAQRVGHFLDLCQSLGLNPRSRPFDWIEFYDPESGGKKLTLYPNQSCAAQLRRQHQISIRFTRREPIGGGTDEPMFVVEVEGSTPTGRTGSATKYVSLMGRQKGGGTYRLSGQQLANAYMKAETGALRRLTLSMVGLSTPADFEDLQRARVMTVDGTGRVLENPTDMQKALAERPDMARSIGEPTYETTAEQWPETSTALDGYADQRVRPEELEQPKREGPPPSFKNSDEDIARRRGAWFATVKGLSLDSDEARAKFVAQWSADEWPKAKRTDSLTTFFKRATKQEAEELLGHVRALCDDERRELLATADEAAPEVQPSGKRDRVREAVALTGGPPMPSSESEQTVAF